MLSGKSGPWDTVAPGTRSQCMVRLLRHPGPLPPACRDAPPPPPGPLCCAALCCVVLYAALYQGADTAVKVMLADGLDKACQREILVAPQLSHPNVRSRAGVWGCPSGAVVCVWGGGRQGGSLARRADNAGRR